MLNPPFFPTLTGVAPKTSTRVGPAQWTQAEQGSHRRGRANPPTPSCGQPPTHPTPGPDSALRVPGWLAPLLPARPLSLPWPHRPAPTSPRLSRPGPDLALHVQGLGDTCPSRCSPPARTASRPQTELLVLTSVVPTVAQGAEQPPKDATAKPSDAQMCELLWPRAPTGGSGDLEGGHGAGSPGGPVSSHNTAATGHGRAGLVSTARQKQERACPSSSLSRVHPSWCPCPLPKAPITGPPLPPGEPSSHRCLWEVVGRSLLGPLPSPRPRSSQGFRPGPHRGPLRSVGVCHLSPHEWGLGSCSGPPTAWPSPTGHTAQSDGPSSF